ncbi:glutathione S-transferase 3-like [Watersipora subatra]|uniref:glutathione S-transferase 3-like n=1 Tax=Watersipora subatra TaxID=2589382 RepID=UPI00355B6D6B
MAEETYKLTYFNLRAREKPARAMFTMAGQNFEDIRILLQNWENLKPSYLSDDDDEFERVQCNSVLHTLNDLSAFHYPSPDNIEELKEQARCELRTNTKFIQGLLREGSKFIFGDRMTAADITMFCSWMLIKPAFPWSEFNSDWLNKVMENMKTDSKLAKCLQE